PTLSARRWYTSPMKPGSRLICNLEKWFWPRKKKAIVVQRVYITEEPMKFNAPILSPAID
ncbi:MAG: hypothetical protein QF541_08505, partial [Lentisphaeria bacterium]|nr:hypothetical protein [Lentisphaeria bacterium]